MTKQQVPKFNPQEGIAYAFLQTVGRTRKGIQGRMRLQFYQYPSIRLPQLKDTSFVWQCWSRPQKKYPSTLFVTASFTTDEIDMPPDLAALKAKSMLSIHEQQKIDADSKSERDSIPDEEIADAIPWRRMQGQKCLIPNKQLYRADTGQFGCFTVAFSSSGFYLAAACVNENSYVIKIFDTLTGTKIVVLEGHVDLVYEIAWSDDEKYLITASSDGTVRVWDVFMERINNPKILQTYHHPSFVYTVQPYPLEVGGSRFILSGCHDKKMRVWEIVGKETSEIPKEEVIIDAHDSSVNSLRINKDGSRVFTGDNTGEVAVWTCEVQYVRGKQSLVISKLASFRVSNTSDSPISCINLHPAEKRLLVQTRDNSIRVVDVRILKVIQEALPKITSSSHLKAYSRATYSPCGTFIFAAYKSTMIILLAESLQIVNNYPELYPGTCVMSISFHPYDHSLACCGLGPGFQLVIFTRDEAWPILESAEILKEEKKQGDSEMEQTLQQIQNFINKSALISE